MIEHGYRGTGARHARGRWKPGGSPDGGVKRPFCGGFAIRRCPRRPDRSPYPTARNRAIPLGRFNQMAQLTIIYDDFEPPLELSPPQGLVIKVARLSLSEDLSETDIYEVARKLAELLLEQLS